MTSKIAELVPKGNAPKKETKFVLHVTAGDANWTPTPKEMTKLKRDFLKAIKSDGKSVVVTRSGVDARILYDAYDDEGCDCNGNCEG